MFYYSEGHDRTEIGLPGNQDKLLQQIKAAISKTTPMIVILMSGGPVDITTAKVQDKTFHFVAHDGVYINHLCYFTD